MNTQKTELSVAGRAFEDLKQINTHGAEYWSARDLQLLLGYSQWRRFEQAIERAISSCKQSGNSQAHHFAGVGKPITGGKGAVRVVDDYHLSRFACYLIAQNGDPRKPEIARAQKYLVIVQKQVDLMVDLC
jgi:DNA-damage-inducible protein D